VAFGISGLERIEQIVGSEMFFDTSLNHTFSEFRQKGKFGDRMII
jgi:hypothetical protein